MTKNKTKTTQSQLAASLGVSRQLIAHHVKSGNAPGLSDTAGWIEYLAAHGRTGSLPPEMRKKIADQRLRLVRAQAERVEIENRIRRAETIPFSLVTTFIRHLVANLFFGELDRLAYEFPATLKGKDELAINIEVEAQIARIKKSIEQQVRVWGEKKGQV
ncbi:MAG: hypothetical protein ABSA45_12970 [Verrucomicrobiota bacterium]